MANKISVYIHIPFCLSKCDYCDFFSVKCNGVIADEYVNALCTEFTWRMQELNHSGPVQIKTIYIGGGTPSLLTKEQLAKLTDLIFSYDVCSDFEYTVELNPDDITKELLDSLEQCRVNRISCGVQSFSQTVLKSVHRRADSAQVMAALELLTRFWHGKISLDLISGLPFETEESLLEGLKTLCSLRNFDNQLIHHISLYSLCVEENTPLYDKIQNQQVDYNPDFSDSLWLKGRDFLIKNGYEQYEVSNFCLKNNECMHNMTYWQSKDYIGIGAGATGTIHNPDGSAIRTTNTKDIAKYIQKPGKNADVEEIDIPTAKFEFFMMGLRTSKGIDKGRYIQIFNEDFPEKVQKIIQNWQKKGLMTVKTENESAYYALNQKGILFLNTFLEQIIDLF